mgnify:CR=1 FL=1
MEAIVQHIYVLFNYEESEGRIKQELGYWGVVYYFCKKRLTFLKLAVVYDTGAKWSDAP